MIASSSDQDTACRCGIICKLGRDDSREAQFVEHGRESGEDPLGAADLEAPRPHTISDAQDSRAGHTGFIPTTLYSVEWPVAEPRPRGAVATSLPPSPLDIASQTSLRRGRRKFSISEQGESSTKEPSGRLLNSTRTSTEMSQRSMSLDSTPAVYDNFDDRLRYPRPKSPPASSFVDVGRAEKPAPVPKDDLKLLARLRERVRLLRLQVQGQRVLVESKREEQSDADEMYIKWIRTHHTSRDNPSQMDTSEVQALEALWKLCQAARNAYGPAAESLLSLEYGLEVEEARLEKIEGRVYGQLYASQTQSRLTDYLADSESDASEGGDRAHSSSGRSRASQNTSQVDYDDYLWRLGNLDLLQEQYQGLMNDKSMLEEERKRRQRVGLDLDSEDADFLEHFEDTLEPVKKELAEVSADVERLKQVCIGKGLVDSEGNPTRTPPEDVAPGSESGKDYSQSGLPTDHSKPSPNQEPSGNNQREIRVSDSRGGFGPFINDWLLHKLRSSTMEILLLAYFVATRVRNMGGLRWQAEAIRLWTLDGTEVEEVSGNAYGRDSSELGSSIRKYDDIANDEKAKQVALPKKARSMRSPATQISLFMSSCVRPRAKSAF